MHNGGGVVLSRWGQNTKKALQRIQKGARLRGATLFEGTLSPATEDFDNRLDIRFEILPRLEGVLDRGDLCSHRGW